VAFPSDKASWFSVDLVRKEFCAVHMKTSRQPCNGVLGFDDAGANGSITKERLTFWNDDSGDMLSVSRLSGELFGKTAGSNIVRATCTRAPFTGFPSTRF
jgi:hypothetical protein